MGMTAQSEKKESKFLVFLREKIIENMTLRYVLKRIGASLITLILLVAIVTALIRAIPDTKLYSMQVYNKIKGSLGATIADNYIKKELYKYGRYTIDGRPVSVIENIFTYIYYILPIYKEVPYAFDLNYEKAIKSWKGFIYLGRSISTNEFVAEDLIQSMPISLYISLVSVFFTYLFAFPLGVSMAKKPGGIVDKIGTVFIVLNYAIPALVFYLLLWSFAGDKNGPVGFFNFGYRFDENNFFGSLFIPIFAIVFLSIPGVIVWVRRFMVDELNSDYVKFARSKGLSENSIMYTHVLRNASVPLVRNIPATLLSAMIGSYFVEKIWSIPGTGKMLINALNSTDVSAIQGLTFLYSAISMLAFLLGDLVTVAFDPRIKLQG